MTTKPHQLYNFLDMYTRCSLGHGYVNYANAQDVGTKLQVIITKMVLRIQEKGAVLKDIPLVHPANNLFWFNRPHLLLLSYSLCPLSGSYFLGKWVKTGWVELANLTL
ncbi:hypothetical protein HanPSC8_Chr12g0512401 [Helianthus annuus]|nr:hypothetical protein HanPSC8_Chr12g0512401 [Helianthus annuus]